MGRLMLMPTMEATTEAMAWALVLAMAMEDTDLATAMEAMVLDTVWDSTERERPRLRPVTTRTGAMATGPGATMVMAMVTVSTTDKRSDENCQSSIEFRYLNQFC